jgi:hypothetical protein
MPKKNLIIILGMFLITVLVVDFQFKQLESLQVSVSRREMSQVNAIHKEMYSGLFSGAVLTYGTSTISYRLYGMTGLAISGTSPIIASVYLKIVEFWRRQVFLTTFPLFFLFGSGLGYLLLAIEFTLRGVDGVRS